MENVSTKDVASETKREEVEMLAVEMHLGTNILYRPAPAVLDTV